MREGDKYVYQNDQENERNNLVPHLSRFEPLRVMAIFALIYGRGVDPSRFGSEVQKLHQKFRSYMGPPLVALTQN